MEQDGDVDHIVDALRVSTLLGTLWLGGWLVEKINMPAMIAEILIGIILGPSGLDFVPYVDAFTVVGLMGLLLLVLEGGLHIDLLTLRKLALPATAVALTGTMLPVLCSWAILPCFSVFETQQGLIAGISLSSTAIGMVTKLMAEVDMLSTRIGKLICCAAMIDDVASLVLLAIVSNIDLNKGTDSSAIDGWLVVKPLLVSLAFIVGSLVLASVMKCLAGRCYNSRASSQNTDNEKCTRSLPDHTASPSSSTPSALQRADATADTTPHTTAASETPSSSSSPVQIENGVNAEEVSLVLVSKQDKNDGDDGGDVANSLMPTVSATSTLPTSAHNPNSPFLLFSIFVWSLGMTAAAYYINTTYLLGAFMGGVCFAGIRGSVEVFDAQVADLSQWTSRIFFASIGFSVPLDALFLPEAVGFGLLLTVIAVLSKFVTGAMACAGKQNAFVIGWAMVGRGELGFIMAEQAYSAGLTTKITFVVTIWALLLATLISPLLFRWQLKRGNNPQDVNE